ncbi:hypothetical protein H059_42326 [Staphylococcus aureus KLT6]|nr:hypothetical protein H059_42326 [Staphylococcus aureus KLT6]
MQLQNSNHFIIELKITHKKQIHFLNYMKTKNLNHFIYSISDLRNLIKDNALFHNYISQETKKFQSSLNLSIAHFLKHKTITMNDQNYLRAYLIIDLSISSDLAITINFPITKKGQLCFALLRGVS